MSTLQEPLITLTGWGMLIKSVMYFLLPESTIRAMLSWGNKSGIIYFGGLISLVLGAVLSYQAYFV